jgi:hypothetical protein
MKVLFLDIDGVLNTPKLIRKFGFDFIDDILVALVARIVKETEAKIVLSSTWRLEDKDKRLVIKALANHGLYIHDYTPHIKTEGTWTERRVEIQTWLDQNTVTKFAIIDDWADAGIGDSFFQTKEEIGLTVDIAEKIIFHLS